MNTGPEANTITSVEAWPGLLSYTVALFRLCQTDYVFLGGSQCYTVPDGAYLYPKSLDPMFPASFCMFLGS